MVQDGSRMVPGFSPSDDSAQLHSDDGNMEECLSLLF